MISGILHGNIAIIISNEGLKPSIAVKFKTLFAKSGKIVPTLHKKQLKKLQH